MIKPSNLICININKLNINIKCIVFKYYVIDGKKWRIMQR